MNTVTRMNRQRKQNKLSVIKSDQVPSWEPLAVRSGRTGAVEVEGKSRKDKKQV